MIITEIFSMISKDCSKELKENDLMLQDLEDPMNKQRTEVTASLLRKAIIRDRKKIVRGYIAKLGEIDDEG
jgi:hypothetical protein